MIDRCRIGCWLAVPAFLWRAWPSWWSTVDDAWISARYASNLVAGNGLVYSVGEPAVEGYTNLLWTLWLAVGIALGVEENLWMTTSGLLFGALCIPLLGELVRAMLPVDAPGRRWPAVVVCWIAALDVHHAIASTNGLETSMYTASLLAAAWVATRGVHPVLTGLVLAALATVRPEGLLAGALLLGMAAWSRADLGRAAGALACGWLGIEAWRYGTYGAWLPNTFAAKAIEDIDGTVFRNLDYLSPGVLWWIPLAGLLLVTPWLRRHRQPWVLAAIAFGSTAAALRVVMWMPGARLLVPTGFLVLAMAGAAAHRRLGAILLWGLLALALVLPFTRLESLQRGYDRHHSVSMPNPVSQVATHLRTHLPAESWIAVRDAGVFAYFVGPENKVSELHNRALTLPHPDGASTDVRRVTPANPEVFVITVADPRSKTARYGGDRTVHGRTTEPYTYLGRIEQHYRRYYDVYVRDDLGIPSLPPAWITNRNGLAPRAPRAKQGPKKKTSDR